MDISFFRASLNSDLDLRSFILVSLSPLIPGVCVCVCALFSLLPTLSRREAETGNAAIPPPPLGHSHRGCTSCRVATGIAWHGALGSRNVCRSPKWSWRSGLAAWLTRSLLAGNSYRVEENFEDDLECSENCPGLLLQTNPQLLIRPS